MWYVSRFPNNLQYLMENWIKHTAKLSGSLTNTFLHLYAHTTSIQPCKHPVNWRYAYLAEIDAMMMMACVIIITVIFFSEMYQWQLWNPSLGFMRRIKNLAPSMYLGTHQGIIPYIVFQIPPGTIFRRKTVGRLQFEKKKSRQMRNVHFFDATSFTCCTYMFCTSISNCHAIRM